MIGSLLLFNEHENDVSPFEDLDGVGTENAEPLDLNNNPEVFFIFQS